MGRMPLKVDMDIPGGRFLLDVEREWDGEVPDLDTRAELSGRLRQPYERIDPSELPDRLRLLKKNDAIPDGFSAGNGMRVVSARVREMLEAHDPGLHQFVPVDLRLEDGSPASPGWSFLVVLHRQDSFVPELSHAVRRPPSRTPSPNDTPIQASFTCESYTVHRASGTVLDPAKLDGSDLWREEMIDRSGSHFMSGALDRAMKEAGIVFFRRARTKRMPARGG